MENNHLKNPTEHSEHVQKSPENLGQHAETSSTSSNKLTNIPHSTGLSHGQVEWDDSDDLVNISIKCTKGFRRKFNKVRGLKEQKDFIIDLFESYQELHSLKQELEDPTTLIIHISENQLKLLQLIQKNRENRRLKKRTKLPITENLDDILKGICFAEARLLNLDEEFYTGLKRI